MRKAQFSSFWTKVRKRVAHFWLLWVSTYRHNRSDLQLQNWTILHCQEGQKIVGIFFGEIVHIEPFCVNIGYLYIIPFIHYRKVDKAFYSLTVSSRYCFYFGYFENTSGRFYNFITICYRWKFSWAVRLDTSLRQCYNRLWST